MSLSTQVLVGFALGIASGIFFGEYAASLEIVGQIFVGLLQMTVLPYMTVSLIVGLGRLRADQAILLAKRCGLILLLLWGIILPIVALVPLAFPDWESASFFSTSLVEQREPFDFLGLYIPVNPFHSLAQTIVPAVVLFSVAVGVALIGIEKKDVLIEALASILDAMGAIAGAVVRLAPIGVFAIAASAAGTLDVSDLGRLQVYVAVYVALALVLSFWVLPVLVTSLTPFSYTQVIGQTRDALVTAFATGNMMVVLPLLTERCKEFFYDLEMGGEETDSAVEVIVPSSFNFPSQGTLLSIGFVLFAGWFSGAPLSLTQYPNLIFSGLASFFGGVYVAIPFLLDMFQIPADTFRLFVTVDVITGRFGTLVSAVHTVALTLLGAAAMSGRLVVRPRKLIPWAVVTVALTLSVIVGIRVFFATAVEAEYTGYRQFISMDLSQEGRPARVFTDAPAPVALDPGRSRVAQIRERGFLRSCYTRDALPWAFMNSAGKLVGFDVEMAHLLATDLDVRLEFVRVEPGDVQSALRRGVCDIVMSGYPLSPDATTRFTFSKPYIDNTLGLIVKDHRRDEFSTFEGLVDREGLRIAIPKITYFSRRLRHALPNAKIVELDSVRAFFRSKDDDLDALLFSAEAGSSWTLVYPRYSVVVPGPRPVTIANAYPVAPDDEKFREYVDSWVDIRKSDGTVQRLFDYWILGKDPKKRGARWSVIRNVLGWVD